MFIIVLTGCSKSENSDIEKSFNIISELCKANFAPTTKEEYTEVFNKYKDTCISATTLGTFFDTGKEVHTNVMMTDYKCKYYKNTDTDFSKYIASMHLSNGSLYTDIQVEFIVRDGKFVNVIVRGQN